MIIRGLIEGFTDVKFARDLKLFPRMIIRGLIEGGHSR